MPDAPPGSEWRCRAYTFQPVLSGRHECPFCPILSAQSLLIDLKITTSAAIRRLRANRKMTQNGENCQDFPRSRKTRAIIRRVPPTPV